VIPEPSKVYAYLFFLLYGTATAALAGWVVNRHFGRHRLLARISPEPTVEGAAAALGWALLWSLVLGHWLPAEFTWPARLVAGVLFGLMGPLGDLVMRYVLQDLGLKTPANAYVPHLALGHLHRLIFVAPLFFRLVHWLDPNVLQPPP
jgi:phosphatidate cytidylyltransferase